MYEGIESYATLVNKMSFCKRCRLSYQRSQVVIYRGNPRSDIMVIGEAPGTEEDNKGLPMVGRTGAYLVEQLHRNELTLNDYMITNIILCHPPQNRDPKPDEIDTCSKWLFTQLDNVQPKVIIPVGRLATEVIIPGITKKTKITTLEGRVLWVPHHKCHIIPIRHPSAILRNQIYRKDYEKMIKILVKDIRKIITGEVDLRNGI